MLTARLNGACSPGSRTFAAAFPRGINELFESMLTRDFPGARLAARALPPMNVWEDAQNIYVEAELPGFAIEDLDITLAENQLTITGVRKPASVEGASFIRRERPVGKFTRVLRVGPDVAADRIGATLKDGVLTVTLPKAPEAQPRKISVSAK